MPLYEYECTNCHRTFESIEKHDVVVMDCPYCLMGYGFRQMSAPGRIRVKGFSAANGYNLPNVSDIMYADGSKKDKWGR